MATEITIEDLLAATIEYGASDLHIRANMPPELRVHGELQPISEEDLAPEDTYELCKQMCSEHQLAEVERNGGVDFALAHADGTRFRVSVFRERKNWGAVLRMIPSKLLTLEQIGLPDTVKELLFKPRGLILVTGPTGSGKTTTLYACLGQINLPDRKIITVEDPVEYQMSGINQVQVNRDVGLDFSAALRSILRQAPRVTADGASLVCSVENTRWPVRAAWIATSAVSRSRISPMSMMSGS